jgi:hypothetical protein
MALPGSEKPAKSRWRALLDNYPFLIALFIVLTPVVMLVAWLIMPRTMLPVLIMDKTVHSRNIQEHISLSWILNYNKYAGPDGRLLRPRRDYYGFFPDDKGNFTVRDFAGYTDAQIDSVVNLYEVAYFTDSYGIYRGEWEDLHPPAEDLRTEDQRNFERSRILYGGLHRRDLDVLIRFRDQGKTIINEFNMIASPTSAIVRQDYQREFGITWSGWIGRYFESLDTTINKDLPDWLKRNYLAQNDSVWTFTKSGIVLVHSSDRILILERDTHLTRELPFIRTTSEIAEYYGVPVEMKYPFWFDITFARDPNEVVATYQIFTNAVGDSLLDVHRLSPRFPAVIRHRGDYQYYYFAGDFADNPVTMTTSYFRFVTSFRALFYGRTVEERGSFFWNYYRPMVQVILEDAMEHRDAR